MRKTSLARLRSLLLLGVLLLAVTSLIAKNHIPDPEVYIKNAKHLLAAKNFSQAERQLNLMIKHHPYDYKMRAAFFLLGESKRKQGNYLDAIKFYNILSSRFPHSKYRIVINYVLGQAYFKLNIYRRAKIYLDNFLRLEKRPYAKIIYKINSNLYLAKIYARRKKYKNQERKLQKSKVLIERHLRKNKSLVMKKILKIIYYQLGIIYDEVYKNKDQAYYYLSQAIKMGKSKSISLKYKMRKLTIRRFNRSTGLPDNNIADIKVDGDDVYIATWGNGLLKYSRSTEKLKKIRLLSSQIRSLYVTYEEVFINTYDGIFIFDKSSNKVKQFLWQGRKLRLAQKIYKDDRKLYFTTLTSGVIEYDIFSKTMKRYGAKSFLKTNMVYSIASNKKYLIIGTLEKGVAILNKKTNEVSWISKSNNKIKGNNIKCLLIDGRFLWIGVHRYGVYRFDLDTRKMEHLNWRISYPTSMQKRENEILVGSSGSGIRIFNKSNKKITKITAVEGLSSNEVTMIQVEGNYIWVGYFEAGIDIIYRPLTSSLGSE